MTHFVSAIFPDVSSANRAADDLVANGFTQDRISVMSQERHRDALRGSTGTQTTGNKAGEGVATGGVLGAIAGGLIAIASLAVPGGIVVAGPIAAALGGAAAGTAAGGLVGGLVGMGIPEDEARTYDRHIQEGRIMLSVEVPDASRANTAEQIMRRAGASTSPNISTRGGRGPVAT